MSKRKDDRKRQTQQMRATARHLSENGYYAASSYVAEQARLEGMRKHQSISAFSEYLDGKDQPFLPPVYRRNSFR